MRFKMSDFKVLDRVSIGLGGRADEVVFEAIVKDSNSPLHNIKVVLRKLVSTQAKRRGMRAIEILDRNWGVGWNLLSLLLATKPSKRISFLDALGHPFLRGPRWQVVPSMDIMRWGLGSTAVRITEE